MRLLPVLALFALASCGREYLQDPPEPTCPWTNISAERDSFEQSFTALTGRVVNLSNYAIVCLPDFPLPKDLTGSVPALGVTHVEQRTITLSNTGESLGSSAFYHELLHAALYEAYGDPDVNHSLPDGPWTRSMSVMVGGLKVAADPEACAGGGKYFDLYTCMEYLQAR